MQCANPKLTAKEHDFLTRTKLPYPAYGQLRGLKGRHLLSITDLSEKQFEAVLHAAKLLKAQQKQGERPPYLQGKTAALYFEKKSTRTRMSFIAGISQLGGSADFLNQRDLQLERKESIEDTVKMVSLFYDAFICRLNEHTLLEAIARISKIPVINALTDLEHPCQILADFLTIQEYKGRLKGVTLAYIGDGENNVTHSLILAAALAGMNIRVASPQGYQPLPMILEKAKALAAGSGAEISVLTDPYQAVKRADVVYTDTWISMGDEKDAENRLRVLKDYQVTMALMREAKKDAIFMHDLPKYVGFELTQEVADAYEPVILNQAENRLHAQKAVLIALIGLV